MQKHDKANLNTHHKCQMCHKQSSNDCLLTDVAHYCVQTGNLTMAARLACKPCREQVLTIRKYVEENALSFSKNSTVFKQCIQPYLPKNSIATLPDESDIYTKNIEQQIKRNKLYHCAKLPQNCLQLVYYSSFSINHAERHERIRNAINEVMRSAPIPLGNLEDVATLVHCLSCYMHESNVILLLKLICERVIIEGSPIAPPNLDSQLPAQRIWRELYSKCYIGNILIIIGEMLKDWRNFDSVFQKLRQYSGYLRKQKIQGVLTESVQMSPTIKKRVSLESPSKYDEFNNSSCKQCMKSKIEYMLNQARIKNLFSLSLKCLMVEDAAQREHIVQIQERFKKQKDEFINKIIKLKDKIQSLQHKDEEEQQPTFRRARSYSEFHSKKKFKRDLEQISEKSEGTIKTIEGRQKHDQNGNTNSTEKPKEVQNLALEYLQRLVINVSQFDPSLLSNDADQKIIATTIENWMKSTKEQLDKLEKKNRMLENQSKRLLTILTRKQQRFVPLIHEKDEIIERYQNCLWRMQHGLIVEDPALAPRIFSIINVFKNQFLENLSNGTLQSDLTKQQMAQLQSPPSKTATAKKKKTEKVREKTEKKLKANQKQCVIF